MAKKKEKTICTYCTHEKTDKEMYWGTKLMFEGKPELGSYYYPICDKCAKKYADEITIAYSFLKTYDKSTDKVINSNKLLDIDFSKCIKGTPTRTGKDRYMFIKDDGKEINLTIENGLKRGYTLKEK